MSHHRTATLAQRLRAIADELESAERYGIPLPVQVSVHQHEHGDVRFHCSDPALFEAWAEYAEADVREWVSGPERWRSAEANVNGLTVRFATVTPVTEAVA